MFFPEWFYIMFVTNQWILFNILGAMLFIETFWYINNRRWSATKLFPLIMTFVIAIIMEFVELYFEGIDDYGSVKRYLLNTAGDIFIVFPVFLIRWFFGDKLK